MKSRRSHAPAVAAANAGFSIATAYRIEAEPSRDATHHSGLGRFD
jgi:hypothetical protein